MSPIKSILIFTFILFPGTSAFANSTACTLSVAREGAQDIHHFGDRELAVKARKCMEGAICYLNGERWPDEGDHGDSARGRQLAIHRLNQVLSECKLRK